MNDKRPNPGTPEFDEWLANRAKRHSEELFQSPVNFDEKGVISGGRKPIEENDKPHIIVNNGKNKSADK